MTNQADRAVVTPARRGKPRASGDGAWLTWAASGAPSVRVFAFPHVGGGAAAFSGLARSLPADIEFNALRLPGREALLHEPPITDAHELVRYVMPGIRRAADGAVLVLFGYCSGAIAAHVVAGAALDHGPALGCLVVAGQNPPAQLDPNEGRALAASSSAELWDWLAQTGATPEGIAADPKMRRVFEPALRADLTLSDSCRAVPVPELRCPLLAVCGADDPTLAPEDLAGWGEITSGPLSVRVVPGGRLLLNRTDELAAVCLVAQRACPSG